MYKSLKIYQNTFYYLFRYLIFACKTNACKNNLKHLCTAKVGKYFAFSYSIFAQYVFEMGKIHMITTVVKI